MKTYLPVLIVGLILSFLGCDASQVVVGQLSFAIAESVGEFIAARQALRRNFVELRP
jgi:5-bromo-4-chloroindolyl phosphate hydrolysis protein